MSPDVKISSLHEEYPRKADLRKELCRPLPVIAPETVNLAITSCEETDKQALAVLDVFNAAVESGDDKKLEMCFFAGQAFWRDMLALTYHLRTFSTPGVIAAAFLKTKMLRGLKGGLTLDGPARFISATPTLQYIDCSVTFRTSLPAATCSGRVILLPTEAKRDSGNNAPEWKIWILSTWIENLDLQAEDEDLLQPPDRNLNGVETINIDVLIIGGGNAGITLAARLKALGVESVMIEKNPQVGDNWAFRYDCLKLHIPTASCEMPFLRYGRELQTPHLLGKEEIAQHLKRYVKSFNLNIITSASIQSTIYDEVNKQWTVQFQALNNHVKVLSKHLVQSTGFGSSKPYIPSISDSHMYKGISVHSAWYKNAELLKEQGAKSAIVIGSANTAFDIVEDCYNAGLKTTMNARSPTYIFPIAYCHDIHGLGAYDHMPLDVADKMLMTLPTSVDAQLAHDLYSHLSSMEPDRYKALAAAGFPMIDSRHPDAVLQHHLLERAGGHYVDIGAGVNLVSEGKVTVKGGVAPVAYTEKGLRFSDGSTVDADVVVWCTGFADHDARTTIADILGGSHESTTATSTSNVDGNTLSPQDVAARLDATMGLDGEGEVRGMWKRHLRLDNYWIMGGHMQLQRWWSRVLAQQIKLALEGILPPAYRDTPESAGQSR
ncbi:FAD/NAD(P)-binding domain-containing protein [Hypoxylon sp. NC0597]|nr:FAD/NAD(P)-binding domain-containing protein [Hypoxylon sp. NC0597]